MLVQPGDFFRRVLPIIIDTGREIATGMTKTRKHGGVFAIIFRGLEKHNAIRNPTNKLGTRLRFQKRVSAPKPRKKGVQLAFDVFPIRLPILNLAVRVWTHDAWRIPCFERKTSHLLEVSGPTDLELFDLIEWRLRCNPCDPNTPLNPLIFARKIGEVLYVIEQTEVSMGERK